jgi:hypothetical protein
VIDTSEEASVNKLKGFRKKSMHTIPEWFLSLSTSVEGHYKLNKGCVYNLIIIQEVLGRTNRLPSFVYGVHNV